MHKMTMNSFKKMIPWWLRICIKIIISRLPVSYLVWKRYIFLNMDTERARRALDNFLEHVQTADAMDRESSMPRLIVNAGNYVVLELGPGVFTFFCGYCKIHGSFMHLAGGSRTLCNN